MNVVFIVLDATRRDMLSPYNPEIDVTEHIEQFAEEATVYPDAVSQAPWTLPSHASMFTGMYPWEHGATQRNLYLDVDKPLLAEQLRDDGYRTACFTANTWISSYTAMTDGFDTVNNFFPAFPNKLASRLASGLWRRLNAVKRLPIAWKVVDIGERIYQRLEAAGDSTTESTIDSAIDFASGDEPFFLFINLMDAHLPYRPPETYREKHAPDVTLSERVQKSQTHNGRSEEADIEALKKLYRAEIDYMDDQLGRLFRFFREEGLMEDTLFIITADHGENLGEDGLIGHQFSVTESLVHVPLIIRGATIEEEPEEVFELRQLHDFILANTGDGENPVKREYALGAYDYPDLSINSIPADRRDALDHRLTFVRTHNEKLVERTPRGADSETSMYDLETREEVPVTAEMEQRLPDIGEGSSGVQIDEHDEAVKSRLQDLGYI